MSDRDHAGDAPESSQKNEGGGLPRLDGGDIERGAVYLYGRLEDLDDERRDSYWLKLPELEREFWRELVRGALAEVGFPTTAPWSLRGRRGSVGGGG